MEIGKLYSFFTLAPTVIGDQYTNLKLVQSGLGSQFQNVEDLQTKNIQISNILGVPSEDISTMLCHMFKTENNETIVFADAWINKNTIQVGTKINTTFTVTDITLEDKTIIMQAIESLGYKLLVSNTTLI